MCVRPYIVTDKLGNLVPVPCGHCHECLQQWSRDWRFRLSSEWRNSCASLYLTLTYNDNNLPVAYNDEAGEWQSYLDKTHVQKFLKRVRKNCPQLKFRYFCVGEYGGQYNRCHHHLILFFQNTAGLNYAQMYRLLFYSWGKGFIKLKPTNEKNIRYLTGYFNKLDTAPHITKPYRLMSKSIGLCWLTQRIVNYLFETFKTALPNPFGKGWSKLPRYYRKKLDEMTDRICPYNYGLVWSDIAKWQIHPKPQGVNVLFNQFCEEYTSIAHTIIGNEIRICREQGYDMRNFDKRFSNPNTVFWIWYNQQPVLVNALANDYRLLDEDRVKHKYTKLNEELKGYG